MEAHFILILCVVVSAAIVAGTYFACRPKIEDLYYSWILDRQEVKRRATVTQMQDTERQKAIEKTLSDLQRLEHGKSTDRGRAA